MRHLVFRRVFLSIVPMAILGRVLLGVLVSILLLELLALLVCPRGWEGILMHHGALAAFLVGAPQRAPQRPPPPLQRRPLRQGRDLPRPRSRWLPSPTPNRTGRTYDPTHRRRHLFTSSLPTISDNHSVTKPQTKHK